MSEGNIMQQESPLQSERGTTTIKDGVVSKIVGVAASGVEGVHMGGSSGSGGVLGGVTGSNSQTRGVKVEVGRVETAIDLTMGIDYGRNILGTVEEVRRRISEQVENMTGLRITELNVTINNIVFPDDEGDGGGRRELSGAQTGGTQTGTTQTTTTGTATTETATRPRARTMPSRSVTPDANEGETTPVEPRSRTYAEGSGGAVPEEEVRVQNRPLEEDETARLRIENDRTEEIERRRVSESESRRPPTDPETGGSGGRRRRRNRGDRPEGR